MDPITKAEREELRALHAKTTQGEWHYDDGVTDGEGTADAERGKDPWVTAANGTLIAALEGVEDPDPATVPTLAEMDANGKFIARAHGVVPRLLRALDAADAERDALKAELARTSEVAAIAAKSLAETEEEVDAAESLAWDALGRPDGTHNESNVQRLCAAYGALKAKLAEAIADRKNLIYINSLLRDRPDLGNRAKTVDALISENAALKAKLAALVEAMERIKDIMGGHDGCQGFSSPEDVWGIADKAIAAAKEPQS